MVIRDIKIFHSKGFQNVPKLAVWFENKPSGIPSYGISTMFIKNYLKGCVNLQ
jgi:hypothetical protein